MELYSGKSSADAEHPASNEAAGSHSTPGEAAHLASDSAGSDSTSGEAGRSLFGRIGDAVGRFFVPDRVREAKAEVAALHAAAVNEANLRVEVAQGWSLS